MAPFGGNPWWVYLISAVPALLVTILIFMDQQITAVIVNRKEHKLKVRLFSSFFYLKALFKRYSTQRTLPGSRGGGCSLSQVYMGNGGGVHP